jgi:proteasome assembly chaperone 3
MPEREITGQLLAAQIGSLLVTKKPQEGRLLVVGIGLKKKDLPRSEFRELVGLALKGLI